MESNIGRCSNSFGIGHSIVDHLQLPVKVVSCPEPPNYLVGGRSGTERENSWIGVVISPCIYMCMWPQVRSSLW